MAGNAVGVPMIGALYSAVFAKVNFNRFHGSPPTPMHHNVHEKAIVIGKHNQATLLGKGAGDDEVDDNKSPNDMWDEKLVPQCMLPGINPKAKAKKKTKSGNTPEATPKATPKPIIL